MEALFYLLIAGVLLLVPVGSLLGFLAFRQRDRHASRIEALSQEVTGLRHELEALKRQQLQPQSGTEEAASAAQAVPDTADANVDNTALPLEPEPVPAEPEAVVPSPDYRRPSVETRFAQALKENWMVWLGGLSVSLAGIFMVSHSISAGLIGPAQQLLMALVTGVALHAAAELLRRLHLGTDQVFAALAGGGSVTLYAAMLAGVHHYQLIGPVLALVGLALVSLATMALALVHGPLLAIMGLSGA